MERVRREHLWSLRDWESDTLTQEARRRYREEEQNQLSNAKTGTREFDYFDFASLWGLGPEFVLQFTAVVTIIFAVLALGVLKQIGSEQAGTILAAIAGYVLGHATGRGVGTKGASQAKSEPTTAKPEEVGTGGNPIAFPARAVK